MTETVIGVAVWLLGLCIGSFLNVVIYRLPLGLSINKPTWSFCPHCKTTLAWYDNLPVLGWILLRGRCRYCRAPISIQYPLVEAITGLLFALVFQLLFVEHARVGVPFTAWPSDAPLLLAWLVLVAALLVISVMDLISYYIDPVVTNVAVALGILLMAAWPRPAFVTTQPESPFGAATAATFIASAIWLWRTERRYALLAQAENMPQPEGPSGELPPPSEPAQPAPTRNASFAAGVVTVVLLVGLAIAVLAARASRNAGDWPTYLIAGVFAVVFAAMVRTGAHRRGADEEIHDEIEAEAPLARRNTMHELLWLSLPVAFGGIVYAILALSPAALRGWQAAMHWSPGGDFVPLAGAAFAMHGATVAAAAGWMVRILFTLIFGREAFGLGDIYILAAAGACAGWDIALLGFLLSVGIALLAWIISLLSKRSVMIAFGPPLALGFVLALWWNTPAAARFAFVKNEYWPAIEAQPFLFAGMLLVSGVVAVMLSRLIRRAVEPKDADGSTTK